MHLNSLTAIPNIPKFSRGQCSAPHHRGAESNAPGKAASNAGWEVGREERKGKGQGEASKEGKGKDTEKGLGLTPK